MKTKISMKTIYLILVITIGLVGLGIGSTLAVFTASAEISNPISFSSNLSYNGDIFDTVEVTIGPNATRTTNVSIFNDEQIDGVKYAVWYIYEGNSNDISFVRNQESDIDPSGTDIGQGGTLSMDIKNNTSNTITITIGVTTSKEDIVLPSYMKVITLATVAKYNLTLNKSTGVSTIYYKVNGASSYTSTTTNKTLSVNRGTTYYYYGVPQTGYTMNSCTSSSPCSGTMTSSVTKTLTASRKTYTISYNANGGTGAPAAQTKTYGVALTLSNTKPVKIGYPFLGWATNSSGTGTIYQPGGSFTTNANTTLYAKYSTTLTNYTVYLDVIDTGESYQNTVKHGDEYSKEISTMASGVDVTCTNGQIPNISGPYKNIVTIYINQVTSNTSCEVQWWDY
jgi:repeat protein